MSVRLGLVSRLRGAENLILTVQYQHLIQPFIKADTAIHFAPNAFALHSSPNKAATSYPPLFPHRACGVGRLRTK